MVSKRYVMLCYGRVVLKWEKEVGGWVGIDGIGLIT